jgi:hypothetical protein
MFRLSLSKFGTLTRCLNVIGAPNGLRSQACANNKVFPSRHSGLSPTVPLAVKLGPGNHKVLVGFATSVFVGLPGEII